MIDLRKILRTIAHRTILTPPKVRHCSQTIYEALLGCCRMSEGTQNPQWKDRADELIGILVKIQCPDGGFDIGYDFNFGRLHKKGESTSPELVGLVALCEYARLFGKERAEEPARRAAEWIRKHSLDLGQGKMAIPYGPHSINEVMVYNGTSFACGALGCYLGQFEGDEELHKIYASMIQYMEAVLSSEQDKVGRFWYYCDQLRDDLDDRLRNKIDYYHQMQQVEIHALAQRAVPVSLQLTLIRDATDHVVSLHQMLPLIPYANDSSFFKGNVHLWGFSSVVSGMLEAGVVIPEQGERYRKVAREVMDWIIEHAWNGDHFEAILQQNGRYIDPRHYMVRSDAWVFNAIAASVKHFDDESLVEVADKCYRKMESADFSGRESHASNWRKQMVGKIMTKGKIIFSTKKSLSVRSV